MAWLDENEFRALYVSDEAGQNINSAQIAQVISAGIRFVAQVLGADAAAAVVTASAPYTAGSQALADLREAQGKIAFRELLLIESSRYRTGGIIQAERDQNGQTLNQYEKFADVEARRQVLLTEAEAIIGIYAPTIFAGEFAGVDCGFAVGVSTIQTQASASVNCSFSAPAESFGDTVVQFENLCNYLD